MTKKEIIDFLASHGIHQLNAGESVQDALDYVNGVRAFRVGYQVRVNMPAGRRLSEHEIIAASWKEAFSKTVSEPEWVGAPDEEEIDIDSLEDYRCDTSCVGEVDYCQYCGKPLRVDKVGCYEILNCEACHPWSVLHNCL